MKDEKWLCVNLKLLRLAKEPRLSQASLADKLGVSRSTYDRYERGAAEIPAWLIFKAAQYYGVPMERLFDRPQKRKR